MCLALSSVDIACGLFRGGIRFGREVQEGTLRRGGYVGSGGYPLEGLVRDAGVCGVNAVLVRMLE
jgi:hypothetical protein